MQKDDSVTSAGANGDSEQKVENITGSSHDTKHLCKSGSLSNDFFNCSLP